MSARGLALIATLMAVGCQQPLLEDQPEATANDVLAALAQAGIQAEKRRRGRAFEIRVSRGALAEAWLALRREGLPLVESPPEPVGWVLTPSQAEDQARRGRERALERLLEARPDVSRARIVLSSRGAAAVLRHPAAQPPPRPQIEALIRRGASLADGAPLSLDLHPLPEPASLADRAAPPVAAPGPPASGPGALWLGALAGLGGLCLVLLWRLRRSPIGAPS